MADMDGVMRIGLRVFHHDPFGFSRATPEVRLRGEHLLHDAPRVFRGFKIEIDVSLYRFHAANAGHLPDLRFDLFSDLLSALRYGKFLALTRSALRRSLNK